MNAQTIQDSVNKYRYGVKIGNYNEETFGRDAAQKQDYWKIPQSTAKDHFNLGTTAYNMLRENKTSEEKEFEKLVKFDHKGLQKHLLFGHGVTQDYFEKRQLTTTYDLSFNRQVKPQVQIYSKYEPELTVNAMLPKKDEIADKVSSVQLVADEILKQPKKYVHYDEFTKHFDSNHIKIPLRR